MGLLVLPLCNCPKGVLSFIRSEKAANYFKPLYFYHVSLVKFIPHSPTLSEGEAMVVEFPCYSGTPRNTRHLINQFTLSLTTLPKSIPFDHMHYHQPTKPKACNPSLSLTPTSNRSFKFVFSSGASLGLPCSSLLPLLCPIIRFVLSCFD